MSIKKVEQVIAPRTPHFVGDGFRVHNFIPGVHPLNMQRMDPFLMLDYNSKFNFPPSDKPKGVGVHPHRGFETVTIAYKGKVAHNDSAGGGGVIGEGDVQWMTAASGVLHKEFHEEEFSKAGGEFQMVQLWVNLPREYKMSAPKYQGILNAEIPKFTLADGAGTVEVIAGSYEGTDGAADTFTPVHLYNTKLKTGGKASFRTPSLFNTGLLVIEGSVRINDSEDVPTDHFALFANEGDEFSVVATDDAIVLVLSGLPINEPIVSHGPFVMNSRQEIMDAIDDLNNGKFGVLAD